METSAHEYLKGVIEAIFFISEKPVELSQLTEVLEGAGGVDLKKLIAELKEEYETRQRGMVIVEIAGGYQMLSSPHYASYIRSFLKTKVKEKLSRPALEALAIVAYKQPVSRGDIELIRGVNSDGVVLHLLNKGLIKIVGKKDVPGRPFLYGTTKLFLEYFGLKSLRDLPKLEDVTLSLSAQDALAAEAQTGPVEEGATAEVSQALDEAEKKAAAESRLPETLQEERLLPQGESDKAVSEEADEALSLKEAMDEMARDESSPDVAPENRISQEQPLDQ